MSQKDDIEEIYQAGTYTSPTPVVGKGIIKALLEYGCSKQQALWVYQSKHVRWFFDGNDSIRTGKAAYEKFTRYLKKGYNQVKDDMALIQKQLD